MFCLINYLFSESASSVNDSVEQRSGDDPFKQIDPMWPIKRFQ